MNSVHSVKQWFIPFAILVLVKQTKAADIFSNGCETFSKKIKFLFLSVCLFDLILYVQVNNCSLMSGRFYLG